MPNIVWLINNRLTNITLCTAYFVESNSLQWPVKRGKSSIHSKKSKISFPLSRVDTVRVYRGNLDDVWDDHSDATCTVSTDDPSSSLCLSRTGQKISKASKMFTDRVTSSWIEYKGMSVSHNIGTRMLGTIV